MSELGFGGGEGAGDHQGGKNDMYTKLFHISTISNRDESLMNGMLIVIWIGDA